MSDLHPFQRRGLGFAPFRLVSVQRHAGGGCAYCGNLISHRFICSDVDGREFTVGSDCIANVNADGRHDPELVREAKRMAKEAEREEWNRRYRAAFDGLRDNPTLFTDQPHPWKRDCTLRDDVFYRLGGLIRQSERQKAVVQVERAIKAMKAADLKGQAVGH